MLVSRGGGGWEYIPEEDINKVMEFLARSLSRNTYVNVMSQYRPCGRAREMPPLAEALSPLEYDQAVREAKAAGITRLDKPRRVFRLW